MSKLPFICVDGINVTMEKSEVRLQATGFSNSRSEDKRQIREFCDEKKAQIIKWERDGNNRPIALVSGLTL